VMERFVGRVRLIVVVVVVLDGTTWCTEW